MYLIWHRHGAKQFPNQADRSSKHKHSSHRCETCHTQGNMLGKQRVQRDRSGVRWIYGIRKFSDFGQLGARHILRNHISYMISLNTYVYIHVYIYRSRYIIIHSCIYIYMYLNHLYIYIKIYKCTGLSIYLSIYLAIYPILIYRSIY